MRAWSYFPIKFSSVVAIAFVMGCSHSSQSQDKFATLKIYHTNDVHSHLEPGGNARGGLAYLASVLKVIRKQEKEALIVDAGDFYKKGSLPARKTGDEVTADLLNALPYYDVRAVGNNEVKIGVARLQAWAKKKEPCPLISANFVDKDGQPVFNPYVILKKADLKVGIIGVTFEWPIEENYQPPAEEDHRAPYKIIDAETAIAPLIKSLRPQVDVLILLSHQIFRNNEKLLKTFPEVDLIVSGHAHVLTPDQKKIGTGMTVEAGAFAEQLGVVTVVYDKEAKKVSSIEGTSWPIGAEMQIADPDIDKMIKSDYLKYAPEAHEKLARVASNFTLMDYSRPFESSTQNFVADVVKAAGKTEAGCINRVMVREPIYKGELTKDRLNLAVPYEDEVVNVDLPRKKFQNMFGEAIVAGYLKDEIVPFAFSGVRVKLRFKDDEHIGEILVEPESSGDVVHLSTIEYVTNHCEEFFAHKYCPFPEVRRIDNVQKALERIVSEKKDLVPPLENRIAVE